MLKFFLDAFTKPIQLYLRPQANAQSLRAILPEGTANTPLLLAVTGGMGKIDYKPLFNVVGREYLKFIIAFLWLPIIYFAMKAFIPEIQSIDAGLGISFLGLLLFIPFGAMFWRGVIIGLLGGWGFLIAFGFMGIVHYIFLQQYAFANYGEISPETIARTVDSQKAIFATAALAMGLALFARLIALANSKWAYVFYGLGILLSVAWYFSAPSIAETDAIVQANRAMSIAFFIAFSGIWLYPLGFLLSLITAVMPNGGAAIWRFSPAYWDEFYMLPVPRLSSIYVSLKATQPGDAQEFAKALSRNPLHRRALPKPKPLDDYEQFTQKF